MLGSCHVLGIDIDPGAIELAQSNIDDFEELPVSASQMTMPEAHKSGFSCLRPGQASNTARGHALQIDLLQLDCSQLCGECVFRWKADTVVMNPPFGTRRKGADMEFLEAAFKVSLLDKAELDRLCT